VKQGGEKEVLRRGRDTMERPDHVHRAAAAHWPLRRGRCFGQTMERYRATSSRGVLWLKVIHMHTLGRVEMDKMRLAPMDCHRWPRRTRPEHDKPVKCSSPYRSLLGVTSYHEHLRVMREWGQGLGKYERGRDELAAVA
jgi:hypothetical protein